MARPEAKLTPFRCTPRKRTRPSAVAASDATPEPVQAVTCSAPHAVRIGILFASLTTIGNGSYVAWSTELYPDAFQGFDGAR